MSVQITKSSIGGLYEAQAKQIVKRYFGGNFEKIVHCGTSFDIYIKDSVDKKELEKFMDMWPEFNINLSTSTRYEKQSKSKK